MHPLHTHWPYTNSRIHSKFDGFHDHRGERLWISQLPWPDYSLVSFEMIADINLHGIVSWLKHIIPGTCWILKGPGHLLSLLRTQNTPGAGTIASKHPHLFYKAVSVNLVWFTSCLILSQAVKQHDSLNTNYVAVLIGSWGQWTRMKHKDDISK